MLGERVADGQDLGSRADGAKPPGIAISKSSKPPVNLGKPSYGAGAVSSREHVEREVELGYDPDLRSGPAEADDLGPNRQGRH
jgi:hypothetical protein